MALNSAGIEAEIREVLLRDKAPEFLAASPKGTVPVLVTCGAVLEESLDIMHWALEQNDPESWLDLPEQAHDLIEEADGSFKRALDRYKYATRYDSDSVEERQRGAVFLAKLDAMLSPHFLFGERATLADRAIQPFIRQFANTDRAWFDAQPWPNLHRWMGEFLDSPEFAAIMRKYPVWKAGDPVTVFPGDPVHASKSGISKN